MDKTELRMKCLELAMNANCGTPQKTVDAAATFLAFVMNSDAGKVTIPGAVFTASGGADGQG